MKRKDIRVSDDMGGYITVYQRPGEVPKLDLNFFDGNREIWEADKLKIALSEAIAVARWWTRKESK